MSCTPTPARCVEPDLSGRRRLLGPDVVVVVVITVLAGALSVSGQPPSAILSVLGGAAFVSVGALLALRGGSGQWLGGMVVRVVQASSPA